MVKTEVLRDAIPTLVSALVGIVCYYTLKFDIQKTDLYYAIASYFLCEIFVRQLFRSSQIRALEQEIRKNNATTNAIIKGSAIMSRVSTDMLALSALDPALTATGQHAIELAIAGIVVEPDKQKLSVVGRDTTYRCYARLWEYFSTLQSERPSSAPLVARMTHKSGIASWSDEYGHRISPQHKRFAKDGGLAFRILIDSEDRRSGNVREYLQFMARMKRDGVHAVYINRADLVGLAEVYWTADFCIVGPNNYVARWILSKKEKVIGFSLRTSSTFYEGHLVEWNDLVDKIRLVDYHADSSDENELNSLRAYKARFIDALDTLQH